MPTYEYRCPDGHDFEKFTQKMSDAKAELPCPTCGKVAPRRMSAGGGLLFKGSGFYITDYGKDGKKDQRAAAKSDAAATATSPAGSAAASDSTGGTASGSTGAPSPAPAGTSPSAPSSPAPAAPSTPKPKPGPEK